MLEELLALGVTVQSTDAWLIRIAMAMNSPAALQSEERPVKIPALRDHTHNPPIRVFESGLSILLYLAEKFGYFLPQDLAKRTETMNWLFWLQGAARPSAVVLHNPYARFEASCHQPLYHGSQTSARRAG